MITHRTDRPRGALGLHGFSAADRGGRYRVLALEQKNGGRAYIGMPAGVDA
jgi:hypothetical protein